MNGHDLKTSDSTSRCVRWARRVIVATAVTAAGLGITASAQGADITPWKVCQAAEMPLAVDFGGLAAPNVVYDAETTEALLGGTGEDPGCEIYNLPPGL